MCDSLTQTVIDSVVDNKVQAGELFTAFDVSLQVQSKLKTDGLFDPDTHRHRYIKNDVHNSIDRYLSNGYSRNLQNVGAPTDAFVYYPQGSDPANYVPITRNDAPVVSANPYTITIPASTSTPSTTAVDSTDPTDGSSDDSGDGRKPDARGTVCVPNYLVRNAGFNPGDKAYVYWGKDDLNQDCLVVDKQVPDGTTVLTNYTVDCNTNIRITNYVLKDSSDAYDFDGNSSQVFVKAR